MDEHPGIVFRDGPAGRRAGLSGGPDIWEVVATLRSGATEGEAAMREVAEILNLPVDRVQTALGYFAAYPDEIDERVRRHFDEADADEALWQRTQAVDL
ncbi:MAG: hypothetical protein ACR2OC_05865 [Solirubrobacterales bacterium]